MSIIEINLVELTKHKLNINEYLTIHKIAKTITGEEFPFSSEQRHLDSLESNGWIIQDFEKITLTEKSNKLIGRESKKIGNEQFDELFELYPHRTPSGRILRSRNKLIAGAVTKNYLVSRSKYLSKVKTIKLHNSIIEATKKMIQNAKLRGAMEYIQQLEVYINQSSWEKYIDENNNIEGEKSNFTKI